MQELKGLGLRTPLVLATIALLGACSNKDAQQPANQPVREIQLAPASGTQPQLNDVPAQQTSAPAPAPAPRKQPQRPRSVAQTPTPPAPTVVVTPINQSPSSAAGGAAAAPAAAPAVVEAPTGTVEPGRTFTVHPAVRICTNTHHVGDRVAATLSETVQGSNGVTIPAGSVVMLRVAESAKSIHSKDSVKLAFDAASVRVGDATYPLEARVARATPIETVRVQSTADQAKKVGVGAAIGALAGQIFGRNTRSTVIGAAVGAGAGVAVAAGTADYDGCMPTTGALTVTLTQPLKVKLATH
ncbi:MAG TPA: hypothetical protein VHE78_18340 [Gemmatimonadaceae bacterium]|nr:hypothetical protein [Gemmatimonadaceae bacterium]